MPWYGFFKKLARADTWVVLDHVKNNPRDSAFWGRRVQVLINGKAYWLSIPIEKKYSKGQLSVRICDMRVNGSLLNENHKLVKSVYQGYKSAPYFEDIFPIFNSYFLDSDLNLSNRNLNFILKILELLSININVVRSSDLLLQKTSTDLLIEIIQSIGADRYICGNGAIGYQNDDLFAHNNIQLVYNKFEHPNYQQRKVHNFQQGLSILDMLFNCGVNETKAWLMKE